MSKLTHLNNSGQISMVDVDMKPDTERIAVARGRVMMSRQTLETIRNGNLKKGDVIAVARIAGIMAAKQTSSLIPLCHQIPISKVDVEVWMEDEPPCVEIQASVKSVGKTGVEMEALTAVSIAALTIYDMAKAIQRDMWIDRIELIEKRGGRSGTYIRE